MGGSREAWKSNLKFSKRFAKPTPCTSPAPFQQRHNSKGEFVRCSVCGCVYVCVCKAFVDGLVSRIALLHAKGSFRRTIDR